MMILFNGLGPLYSTRACLLKFKAWGPLYMNKSMVFLCFFFGLEAVVFDKSMIFSRLEAIVFNKSMTCDYIKRCHFWFSFCWLVTIVLNKRITSVYLLIFLL